MQKRTASIVSCIALAAGSAAGQTLIASDDFDNAFNLISYSAIDAEGNDPSNTGVWSSPSDNFGVRSMADRVGGSPSGNFLSTTIVDASGGEDPGDTVGILTPDYAGNFFAVVDTDNGVNPSGLATGTWTFDISAAQSLSTFSVDMASVGAWFDNGSVFERFTWAYSIDGGQERELFEVRGDASLGEVTYTLANGSTFSVPGDTAAGDDDNGASVNGVALLNELTTLTADLEGSGSELTLTFSGFVNGNSTGLVFDNIEIAGVIPAPAGAAVLGFGAVASMRRRR